MFQRILVPLDGSNGSERAIPVAARIARACGGSIVFIRVVLSPAEGGTSGAGLRGAISVKPTIEASEKELAGAASYLDAIIATYADDLAETATEYDVGLSAGAPA